MGRKKHTPRFLHTPASWFERLNWHDVFGNAAPIEVDVGCGDGTFLVERARLHPDVNFVGIERLLGRARKVDRKAQRLGLTNVRVIRIEAGYAVAWLFPPASVATCHVYFPDPWPKRRHHRRRLFQIEFVNALHRALIDGGQTRVATDDRGYFDAITALFRASAGWEQVMPDKQTSDEPRTDFGLEWARQGRQIYRACFRKISANELNLLAEASRDRKA